MAFSARTRPKGRRSHSAPPGLHTTALRLDSTGGGGNGAVTLCALRSSSPECIHGQLRGRLQVPAVVCLTARGTRQTVSNFKGRPLPRLVHTHPLWQFPVDLPARHPGPGRWRRLGARIRQNTEQRRRWKEGVRAGRWCAALRYGRREPPPSPWTTRPSGLPRASGPPPAALTGGPAPSESLRPAPVPVRCQSRKPGESLSEDHFGPWTCRAILVPCAAFTRKRFGGSWWICPPVIRAPAWWQGRVPMPPEVSKKRPWRGRRG
jgi:hypothetical protein